MRDVTLQMNLPEGEDTPYLEAVLGYPNLISGKEIRVSEKGTSRAATYESVLGGMRNKIVSCGLRTIAVADECNEVEAEALMKNLDTYVDQICEACENPIEM